MDHVSKRAMEKKAFSNRNRLFKKRAHKDRKSLLSLKIVRLAMDSLNCQTNIFLVRDKEDLFKICDDEKAIVSNGGDTGRRVAQSWLDFWPEITFSEGTKIWYARLSCSGLDSLLKKLFETMRYIYHTIAAQHPDKMDVLADVYPIIIGHNLNKLDYQEGDPGQPWWAQELRNKERGDAVPIVRACFYPAAASGAADKRDGWTVGKLSVIKWKESLKYPIEGTIERFTINGEERWQDIEDLMNADGEYIKMRKNFAQRWCKGEYKKLKKAAFPAEEKSPKGKGRYRLLK